MSKKVVVTMPNEAIEIINNYHSWIGSTLGERVKILAMISLYNNAPFSQERDLFDKSNLSEVDGDNISLSSEHDTKPMPIPHPQEVLKVIEEPKKKGIGLFRRKKNETK